MIGEKKICFNVEITSVDDRDDLVAEVWADQQLFAELRRENGEFRMQFYISLEKSPWDFSYDDMIQALVQARKRLGET